MSVVPKTKDEIPVVHLRFGLDAKALEGTLLRHNRSSDVARRALAFYLHDLQSRGLHQALARLIHEIVVVVLGLGPTTFSSFLFFVFFFSEHDQSLQSVRGQGKRSERRLRRE